MAPSGAFSGFTGKTLYTPVPNPVFGPILEQVQDLAELKVTLRGLWLFHRKRGAPRAVSLDEFLADRSLIKGLKFEGPEGNKSSEEAIRRGLRLAVTRGTFLTHQLEGTGTVFLLNTDSGRRAIARFEAGQTPSENGDGTERELAVPELERPNIFELYEDSIGSLSPLLAEELKEAEGRYPEAWLREAFGIAVAENKRSWRYVAGILRRWTAEGKTTRGEAERGKDGKPGRHTEADHRQKYLEDYQRRWGKSPG
ncbi:MAG: DnaD domain protein [Chloroflexi bacterium]|nr:DnaD domain protein [Chloroflexota bacterium]